MTTDSGQGGPRRLPTDPIPREGVVLPRQGDPVTPEEPSHGQTSPPQGQPWGGAWGPPSSGPATPEATPTPPAGPPSSSPGPWASPVAGAPDAPQTPPTAPPQAPPAAPAPPQAPPEQPAGWGADTAPHRAPMPPLTEPSPGAPAADGMAHTQRLAPVTDGPPPRPAGQPPAPPPEGETETTTRLRRTLPPEVPPTPSPAATASDAEETQVLPPMAGAQPGAATLGHVGRAGHRQRADAAPSPSPAGPPPSARPFGIRPGTPQDRPPLAEFDALFRDESPAGAHPGAAGGPAGPADATQRLPLFDEVAAAQEGGAPPPGGRSSGPRRRGLPRPVAIALVVVGCTLAGVAVGAALSGGGDDDAQPQAHPTNSAGTDSEQSAEQEEDPAEEQARRLSELLGESNNSRAAVIRSVENIKKCAALGEAAADLRDAARQRNALVDRLNELTLDRLPRHQALTRALTTAWRASAKADNHYAAWAKQVAGKKGCRKGRAVTTPQLSRGNAASGQATEAKKEAARLWNPTARKYGLPEREITEL